MRVEVLLFAVARQRAGREAVVVDLPEGGTVSALKAALAQAEPALAPLLPGLLFAVAGEYATDDTPVPPGAEVAAIPPVSGGLR